MQTGLQSEGDPSVPPGLPRLKGTSPGTATMNTSAKRGPYRLRPLLPALSILISRLRRAWGRHSSQNGGRKAVPLRQGAEPGISVTLQTRTPEKSRIGPRSEPELRAEPRPLAGRPRAQCDKQSRSGLHFVAATSPKWHLLREDGPEIKPNRANCLKNVLFGKINK